MATGSAVEYDRYISITIKADILKKVDKIRNGMKSKYFWIVDWVWIPDKFNLNMHIKVEAIEKAMHKLAV